MPIAFLITSIATFVGFIISPLWIPVAFVGGSLKIYQKYQKDCTEGEVSSKEEVPEQERGVAPPEHRPVAEKKICINDCIAYDFLM